MRVLVTGASGFIGGVFCRRAIEQGHEVTALVRRPGSEPPGTARWRAISAAAGAWPRRWRRRARIAWCTSPRRSPPSATREGEGGERRAARAVCSMPAWRSGPRADPEAGPRFVFSSTVVTGDARGELLTEDSTLPVETPYGRSKQECERMVLESGLPAVVIRPSHVYGPGGWYGEELVPRLLQPGRFAVIGSGANLWDVVHVEDVASAILLAPPRRPRRARLPRRRRRADHLLRLHGADGCRAGGRPPAADPGADRSRRRGRNAVDAVVRSARSSNARIKRELGWEPRFATAREGVPTRCGACLLARPPDDPLGPTAGPA